MTDFSGRDSFRSCLRNDWPLLLIRLKAQAEAVHAVAQARFGGPVVEQVAQVPAAFGTNNFRADHAMRKILYFFHLFTATQLSVKARPAAVAVKLLIAREQLGAATRAGVPAFFLM